MHTHTHRHQMRFSRTCQWGKTSIARLEPSPTPSPGPPKPVYPVSDKRPLKNCGVVFLISLQNHKAMDPQSKTDTQNYPSQHSLSASKRETFKHKLSHWKCLERRFSLERNGSCRKWSKKEIPQRGEGLGLHALAWRGRRTLCILQR